MAALALLGVGCAVPGERDAGRAGAQALLEGLPGEFTAASGVAALAFEPWWLDLGEEQLPALIQEALEHNPSLGAQLALLEAAGARASAAAGERWPELVARLDAVRQRQVFVGLPLPGGPASTISDNFGLGAELSLDLDLFGRLRALESAAEWELEASALDFADLRQRVAAAVARGWVAAREANLLERLAQRDADSRAASLESVRTRIRVGLRAPLDLHLAESEYQAALAELAARRLSARAAERRLEVLLGRAPRGELKAQAELPRPQTPPPRDVPAAALARRADVAAREARLRALDARYDAARAGLYPQISLGAGAGTRSDRPGDLLDWDLRTWNIAGNLVQPILQGGRLRALVAEVDAERRAALEQFAETLLTACLEVELAYATEAFARLEENAASAARESARAAEAELSARYRAGVGQYLDVLAAERRTLELEVRAVRARRLRLEARIDLHVALGSPLEPAPTSKAADLESRAPAPLRTEDTPEARTRP